MLFALFMQSKRPDGPPFHCDLERMRELFPHDEWTWSDELKEIAHPSGLTEINAVLIRQ